MSKAFTKEPDGVDEEDDLSSGPTVGPTVPSGSRNYMTPAGYKRLREERTRLWKVDRPKLVDIIAWAAGNGDRSENGDY